MKKHILKLIMKFFKQELDIFYFSPKEKESKLQEEEKKIRLNYPVGTKIITQSNEPEDLLVAKVCGYQKFHHGTFILVEKANGEQVFLCDKNPMIYSKEREDALNTLPWFQRYNVMTRNTYYIPYKVAKIKENK